MTRALRPLAPLAAALLALAAAAGCTATSGAGGGSDGGTTAASGLSLIDHLAGLWSGPATQTPLGDFPMMNVDFRAMTPDFFWGRVDLDSQDALRFGFDVEPGPGGPVLTYRNGGYFQGMLRDDFTHLVKYDAKARSYEFCHVDKGCSYIDATYTFADDTHLTFDVKVKGMPHLLWQATRLETRTLPKDYTSHMTPQGPAPPLPPMPELDVTVTWTAPLPKEAQVWVALSTQDCSLAAPCAISRSSRQVVAAGARQTTVKLPEIHPGDYKINVVLDRNENIATTLAPDKGDGVGRPNLGVTVAPTGTTPYSDLIVYTL